MRHGKHKYSLGRVKEHREALMANLASALFRHGRIETTLAKAKALRPFAEKIITMAKKAHLSDDPARKLHYRRLAISRVRDEDSVALLFNERAAEFAKRNGGYSRIYKLVRRVGDAAEMAIIELIAASDVGYSKSRKRRASRAKKPVPPKVPVGGGDTAAAEPTDSGTAKAESGKPEAAKGGGALRKSPRTERQSKR